jgi:uncharacterized protein YbaR (Trm112 family)
VTFTKQTVWVCPSCKEEMGYIPNTNARRLGINETCPMEGCNRVLVERHRWICAACGYSYPGNRSQPDICGECAP